MISLILKLLYLIFLKDTAQALSDFSQMLNKYPIDGFALVVGRHTE